MNKSKAIVCIFLCCSYWGGSFVVLLFAIFAIFLYFRKKLSKVICCQVFLFIHLLYSLSICPHCWVNTNNPKWIRLASGLLFISYIWKNYIPLLGRNIAKCATWQNFANLKGPTFVNVGIFNIISRPWRSQGLLYKHLHDWWIHSVMVCENICTAPPSPNGCSWCFQSKIDYVKMLKEILNPEGHPMRSAGSKVTAILLNGGFFPLVELHREVSAPAACAAGFFFKY